MRSSAFVHASMRGAGRPHSPLPLSLWWGSFAAAATPPLRDHGHITHPQHRPRTRVLRQLISPLSSASRLSPATALNELRLWSLSSSHLLRTNGQPLHPHPTSPHIAAPMLARSSSRPSTSSCEAFPSTSLIVRCRASSMAATPRPTPSPALSRPPCQRQRCCVDR